MEGESQTVESTEQGSQMLGLEDGEPVLVENREVKGGEARRGL